MSCLYKATLLYLVSYYHSLSARRRNASLVVRRLVALSSFLPHFANMTCNFLRLASKMYSETKGERTYKVNKMGAVCLAIGRILKGEEQVNPVSLPQLQSH